VVHPICPSPFSPLPGTTPELPFATLLPETQIRAALHAAQGVFRNTLYNPAITLWLSLSQCLDPTPSLAASVDRFTAWRAAQGKQTRSDDPSAFAKARLRLPLPMLQDLTRTTGRAAETQAPKPWRWHGHRVRVVDGTTLTLSDTRTNQKKYPQIKGQKPGLGFPILRLVVLFSLAVGSVLEATTSPLKGLGTGETTLCWPWLLQLQAGEILLGDRLFCTYWVLARLRLRGAHGVFRLHAKRKGGKGHADDGVRVWHKPVRPPWMTAEEYAQLPETLEVRYVHVRVTRCGMRTKFLVVATTLLDEKQYPADSLAALYRQRWQVEIYLRTLKQTLRMDPLVGQSPALVEREIWLYLLAYNLIREVMTAAARVCRTRGRQLSFQRTISLVGKWLERKSGVGAEQWEWMWQQLLRAVGKARVGNRPDRVEPRKVKRRPKRFGYLTEPRQKAIKRLYKKSST
jgi:IS4 transposase